MYLHNNKEKLPKCLIIKPNFLGIPWVKEDLRWKVPISTCGLTNIAMCETTSDWTGHEPAQLLVDQLHPRPCLV